MYENHVLLLVQDRHAPRSAAEMVCQMPTSISVQYMQLVYYFENHEAGLTEIQSSNLLGNLITYTGVEIWWRKTIKVGFAKFFEPTTP
jgi:hypothetical protein